MTLERKEKTEQDHSGLRIEWTISYYDEDGGRCISERGLPIFIWLMAVSKERDIWSLVMDSEEQEDHSDGKWVKRMGGTNMWRASFERQREIISRDGAKGTDKAVRASTFSPLTPASSVNEKPGDVTIW